MGEKVKAVHDVILNERYIQNDTICRRMCIAGKKRWEEPLLIGLPSSLFLPPSVRGILDII